MLMLQMQGQICPICRGPAHTIIQVFAVYRGIECHTIKLEEEKEHRLACRVSKKNGEAKQES